MLPETIFCALEGMMSSVFRRSLPGCTRHGARRLLQQSESKPARFPRRAFPTRRSSYEVSAVLQSRFVAPAVQLKRYLAAYQRQPGYHATSGFFMLGLIPIEFERGSDFKLTHFGWFTH